MLNKLNNRPNMKKSTVFTISIIVIIQLFTLNINFGSVININNENVMNDTVLCSTPSFSYYVKLPGNLKGYFDYNEGFDCSKQKNRPLLVCFSTYLSVDAMEMFATVLLDPDITNTINENYVFAFLIKDSKVYLPLKHQVISSINGDTIRSLGNKNAYYQMLNFNEDLQPAYYIINSKEELLIDPYYFDMSTPSFKEFLMNGIEKYYLK